MPGGNDPSLGTVQDKWDRINELACEYVESQLSQFVDDAASHVANSFEVVESDIDEVRNAVWIELREHLERIFKVETPILFRLAPGQAALPPGTYNMSISEIRDTGEGTMEAICRFVD